MSKGFIKLNRGFFDNFLWNEAREYSKAEAWLDLIQQARFEASTEIVNGKVIELQKGEIPASRRFLELRWNWGSTKVSNFLKILESLDMIKRKQTNGQTVLKLIKYRVYNEKQTKSKPQTNHEQTTGKPQANQSKEYKELKEREETQEQKGLGEYSDFFNLVLDFFSIVSENHQRNAFSFLMRKINKGEIKEFVEQTNAMMQWKNKNPEEKRANWNNYVYEYDNGTSTDWVGKLGLKVVKNSSTETIVRYKDNVNPTVRSLPKSKYLEMVEANKGGGYEYKIVSES